MEGHHGATNNKQTPAFIQIPDTKANDKYFECIEIAKKYSDLQNIQYYNGRLFKSKERADIIDRLTTPREKHPVTNFTEMRKTIQCGSNKSWIRIPFTPVLTSSTQNMKAETYTRNDTLTGKTQTKTGKWS